MHLLWSSEVPIIILENSLVVRRVAIKYASRSPLVYMHSTLTIQTYNTVVIVVVVMASVNHKRDSCVIF